MTQEDKKLLLIDLSARLPYGLISLKNKDSYRIRGIKDDFVIIKERAVYGEKEFITKIETIKPYLRPMSSMTEEERKEWTDLFIKPILELEKIDDEEAEEKATMFFAKSHNSSIDWLNAHHFDHNGLIEKGLALEAPEGMYK